MGLEHTPKKRIIPCKMESLTRSRDTIIMHYDEIESLCNNVMNLCSLLASTDDGLNEREQKQVRIVAEFIKDDLMANPIIDLYLRNSLQDYNLED